MVQRRPCASDPGDGGFAVDHAQAGLGREPDGRAVAGVVAGHPPLLRGAQRPALTAGGINRLDEATVAHLLGRPDEKYRMAALTGK